MPSWMIVSNFVTKWLTLSSIFRVILRMERPIQKEKSGARRVQPDQVLQGRGYSSREFSTRLGNQNQVRFSQFDLEKRSSEALRSLVFWTNWRTVETRAR